ncbi:MAG: hypothetical protein JST22_18650 [Bacteroidetes bacterium]|nr:hypothetical protein [Bacteroidota bacterium]
MHVEPRRLVYSVDDTVAITATNRWIDTVYVTPALARWHAGRWCDAVDDLTAFWSDPGDMSYCDECASLNPIAPCGSWTIHVSLMDIAASFREHTPFLLVMNVFSRNPEQWRENEGPWYDLPFCIATAERSLPRPPGPVRDTVFAVCDPEAHAPLIPDSVFQHHPYRLVIPDRCDSAARQHVISWGAWSADEGLLELVVAPRQLWLRSAHDNPTADSLYWTAAITLQQHDGILASLREHRSRFMEIASDADSSIVYHAWREAIPEIVPASDPSPTRRRREEADIRRKRHLNVVRLLKLFNGSLHAANRIQYPLEAVFNLRPVRIISAGNYSEHGY